jgi:hypothetical protein
VTEQERMAELAEWGQRRRRTRHRHSETFAVLLGALVVVVAALGFWLLYVAVWAVGT